MDETTELPEDKMTVPDEPSRLRRSTRKRLIGGVAGGVSERFEVDVNIVRVIFVVLACVWGLGVALYLAMWVLIPRDSSPSDEEVSARALTPEATSRWPYVALAAGVVVVALIFSATAGGAPHVGRDLAVLWLIFLVSLAVIALRRPTHRWTFRRLVAMMFLTGLSLVILISGVFLGIVGLTGVPMRGGIGVRLTQPTSLAMTGHSYVTEFGKSTIDLTAVNFPAGGYLLSAAVAVGVLDVVVPANAVVDLRTHVGIGTVAYVTPDGYPYGRFTAVPTSLVNAKNRTGAPHLTLDAQVGVGQIVVSRASK